MDLVNPWKILEENGYVITSTGTGIKVRDKKSDKELQVLQDSQGNVIFAQQRDDGFLEPTLDGTGHPIEIKPVTYEKEVNLHEVDDAGKGTAWVIRRLLDGGYFSATK